MEATKITTQAFVAAPIETVWHAFNDPDSILRWDASDEWRTVWASNDLRVGGALRLRIEPRQAGSGFDFAATYTRVEPLRLIEWVTSGQRYASVAFTDAEAGVVVTQTFDAEPTPSADEQRHDWQGVLDSFARHAAFLAPSSSPELPTASRPSPATS